MQLCFNIASISMSRTYWSSPKAVYGHAQAKLKNLWHEPNGRRPKQVLWWAPSCNHPASSASRSPGFKAHIHNLPDSDNSKPLNYSNNCLNHLMPKKCLSPKSRNFKSNPKATKSNPK